jgi:hypothetical protein
MTAVDWLLENLPLRYKNAMLNTCQEEINKAKAMEKEQICNAYTDGLEGPYLGAEEYYNQIYNQNKQYDKR